MPFDESQAVRVPCTTDTPFLKQYQGQCQTHRLTVRDEEGNALDLTSLGPCSARAQDELSSSTNALDITVEFVASASYDSPSVLFRLPCTILDPTEGTVEVTITDEYSTETGLFLACLVVTVVDEIRHISPYYLELRAHAAGQSQNPLTVGEVRLELYDQCPEANYLIDDYEFTDSEIIHCMRKCVDEWNEALPPVSPYTTQDFPYRAAWMKASTGHLLNLIANKYRRNALRYQAGGLTVADQERYQDYQVRAKELLDEWRTWVTHKKISINVTNGFGYVSSGFGA